MTTTQAVKERPILFDALAVRAILAGKKTQARIALKSQPLDIMPCDGEARGRKWIALTERDPNHGCFFTCKHGSAGDHLWVRETWTRIPAMKPSGYFSDPKWKDRTCWYAADNDRPLWGGAWQSPVVMPRSQSRITLEITNVRIQRLQDITEAEAQAEGIERPTLSPEYIDGIGHVHPMTGYYRDGFKDWWEKKNGAGSWDANPWVWAIDFKRLP